jgi:DNA ligase-1
MRRFVDLYFAMDATNKTNEKVAAMIDYFTHAPPQDAAWALAFLTGRRPRVPVKRPLLKQWCLEVTQIDEWLFDECYSAVGDLSETLALLLPTPTRPDELGSLAHWVGEIHRLATLAEPEQREAILAAWDRMDADERFVWHKLLGGSFRVGVSRDLVIRALSRVSGVPAAVVAHRIMGDWEPTDAFFSEVVSEQESGSAPISKPYPFCLAHPLEGDPDQLGEIAEWQAEWKWDGIRAQLIRRAGETFLWSRGEDMIHEAFPDVTALGELLPDGTVLDGEILAWNGEPMPFSQLQRRINRKLVGKKLLTEVPCTLCAFDLLEFGGEDWRSRPLAERRAQLEKLEGLIISPSVVAASWEELQAKRGDSRAMFAEGLMLKRLDSDYTPGRKRGAWWKWKIAPFTVDAVLIYAARGSGKRASLYTDYTFGVWQDGELIPFAKAYSGLDDAEIRQVDNFIRRNAIEKFGPVRTVKPELVFEIAFEGIQLSTRHKSGIATRFPRILRWRKDKRPEDADTLEQVKALLKV